MWINSVDTSNNLWHKAFSLLSNDGLMVIDNDLEQRVTSNGECVGLSFQNHGDIRIPFLTLTSWNCGSKNSVVCKKNPSNLVSSSKQPKFPCISKHNGKREKREIEEIYSFEPGKT